jgi:hypothetical protein
MRIEISNLGIIEQKVKARIEPMFKAFQKAVETEKEVIRTRTQQGLDVNGRPFIEYSDSQKWNWKDTRNKRGYQTAHVDLTFKGYMFNALKVSFRRDGFKFLATIFFNERKQAQKAKGHHTGQLGRTRFKARKFFQFSQRQRETIVSKIRNAK